MSLQDLKSKLLERIQVVQKEGLDSEEIFASNESLAGKNQFLFFIKPEITIKSELIQLDSILNMVFSKMEKFGLKIQNCRVLSAKYLEEYDIIAQHYGVINKISQNAKAEMSDTAKEKFTEMFGVSADEANLFGSLEFIEKYPEFSPASLDHLWQNCGFDKLAGGTYVQKVKLDGIETFIINGFHPRQLAHFTDKGRSIITFTLVGDTDWDVARGEFIGATNPASAIDGSVRKTLLENLKEYGLQTISSSWNGAHLSAGPVEGLIELIRYNSDFSSSSETDIEIYQFGKQLKDYFSIQQVQKIFENVDVQYEGKNISIFDLTEEKNSEETIALLKKVL